MAIFTGTAGADSFSGTSTEADTFRFNATALSASDTVAGGGGAFTDILQFTAAGSYGAALFANVSGIERIVLANGANSLVLSAALVGSGGGSVFEVFGNAGNDTVNGAGVTGSLRFQTGAGGNDRFTGGTGADTVVVQAAGVLFASLGGGNDVVQTSIDRLDASDTLSGGGGTDRLSLTGGGSLVDGVLAGLSGFEEIAFSAAGTSSLQIGNALLDANGGALTIVGNAAAGAVDSSGVTGGRSVIYNAGGGNDSYLGGAGSDRYIVGGSASGDLGDGEDSLRLTALAADGVVVDGGAGYDVVELAVQGSWTLANLAGFEEVQLLAGGSTLRAPALAALRIEGSSGTDRITVGAAGQAVYAGDGNDVVTVSAATLPGSVLVGGAQATRDILELSGPGNFHLGSAIVTGFERIVLLADASGADVRLGAQAVELRLQAGASATLGSHADQSVVGSRYADTITVRAGGQFADAAGGNDTVLVTGTLLVAGAQVAGGGGQDTLVLGYTAESATLLIGGNVAAFGFESIVMNSSETLYTSLFEAVAVTGSADADDVILRAAGSSVNAGEGNDTLTAAAAELSMAGGSGADTFIVLPDQPTVWSGGVQTLRGGSEAFTLDVLRIVGGNASLAIDFGVHDVAEIDRIQIDAGTTGSIELILDDQLVSSADGNNGGAPNDLDIVASGALTAAMRVDASALTGVAMIVRFDGAGTGLFNGDDTVVGSSVSAGDLIFAGGGNDSVDGVAGPDLIDGGSGNDTLSAGDGADTLTGGAGGDRLVFSADALVDRARYLAATDGSADINAAGVAETSADRITGFVAASDVIAISRGGVLGVTAGGVVDVAANAAWDLAAGAIFLFDGGDTLGNSTLANDFGNLTALMDGINADLGDPVNPAAGRTVLLVMSNGEANAVRRTGFYVWNDVNGNGIAEESDVLRLLGVIDGLSTDQLTAANFQLL